MRITGENWKRLLEYLWGMCTDNNTEVGNISTAFQLVDGVFLINLEWKSDTGAAISLSKGVTISM